jgi:hypothetical protein
LTYRDIRHPVDARPAAPGHAVPVIPEPNPIDRGERREETAMIHMTDFDELMANHAAWVARVNHEGWKRQASATAEVTRTRGISTADASIRQRIGLAVVRAGERLQGAPAVRVVDPAAAV